MRYSDFKIFRLDFVSLYCLIYKIAQDMNAGNTVFSQLMSLIPDYELRKCIDRYRGDFPYAVGHSLSPVGSPCWHQEENSLR